MNLRRIVFGAAGLAAAALAAWAVLTGGASPPGGSRAAIAAPAAGDEPELVLRGVEMREARESGGAWKVVADGISYSLSAKTVRADRVAIALPTAYGELVLRAPGASWETGVGRIRLAGGATAVGAEGLSADVEAGTLDLKGGVFSGQGRAHIAGRGFAVAGDNLVWRWADGAVSLASPKGRIDPAGLPRRKG